MPRTLRPGAMTMPTLSERHRAVLAAVCGTLVPSVQRGDDPHGFFAASHEEAHLVERVERLIGLIAAPLAAAIGLLVVQSLVATNTKTYSSVSGTLALSLFVLAAAMLASAWFRKRLYLGIAMALYGLSIFNLHFWGFGVPYLLFGSWYLVRAYRFGQKLKFAKEDGTTSRPGAPRRAQPNKRFTPPVTGPVKAPKTPKPRTET